MLISGELITNLAVLHRDRGSMHAYTCFMHPSVEPEFQFFNSFCYINIILTYLGSIVRN